MRRPLQESGPCVELPCSPSSGSWASSQGRLPGRPKKCSGNLASPTNRTTSSRPGRVRRRASLVELEPENLIVSALKAAEDGQGLVVRVLETSGKATQGKLSFPFFPVASAQEANAVEAPGKQLEAEAHSVRFQIRPLQVLTIRVQTR